MRVREFSRVLCSHGKQLLKIEDHPPFSVHLPVCTVYDPATDIVPDMSSDFNSYKKKNTQKRLSKTLE